MKSAIRRFGVATLCAVSLVSLGAVPTAAGEPLFVFYASAAKEGPNGAPYPPGSGFNGPCGVAVDSKSAFYVADYYGHAVDAFSSARKYLTQAGGFDPSNGPCALAVDAAGNLYANEYHQRVVKRTPSLFPLVGGTGYGPATTIDTGHPTGVAVDSATGDAYVDNRTYISAYEPSGAPVEVEVTPSENAPLRIGVGTLGDGYGLALSRYPGTAGYLYVADAATDTVKVYDPSLDVVNPVEVIDGHETPTQGFVSLRDSALAVDRVSGDVYVADELQPEGYERPEAAIYVFSAAGAYEGRLPVNIVDARPPGLAVDNSTGVNQGRVYVTSGNTEGAAVYAYAAGSATKSPPICAPQGACPSGASGAGFSALGSGQPPGSVALAEPPAPASPRMRNSLNEAVVAQKGTLRVTVDGRMTPKRLPRAGTAPIAVSVAGEVSTTDESEPPQLQGIRIELNRHGRIDFAGLPTCPYERIQPASSARALSACRSALVGKGRFAANIVLSGQEPYPTEGKLLIFNGERAGKPVLYGQIYSPHPFATSFVIVFELSRIARGPYGTALTASLPKALGSWGYLTAIELRLSRRYAYRGAQHSYISAGCPAPKGFGRVAFPLARAGFSFAGVGELRSTLTRECQVR